MQVDEVVEAGYAVQDFLVARLEGSTETAPTDVAAPHALEESRSGVLDAVLPYRKGFVTSLR